MKKKTIIAILSMSVTLMIFPTTRDEILWWWAAFTDTTASYEFYTKSWPEGRHAVMAKAQYDEHSWADAESANTMKGFERYVQLHSKGKHVAEAKDKIESLQ